MDTLSSQLGLRLTSICDSFEKEVTGRCVKIYRFEPHPRRKVLIILGEVTITIFLPLTGKVLKQWTQEFKKPVQLLGLIPSSKVDKITQDILQAYPYIDSSMTNKLQEAIVEVKARDYDHNGIVIVPQVASDGSFLPRYPEVFDELDMSYGLVYGTDINDDEPDFGKLDHYIEQLYEDIPQKISGSSNMSKLTKFNSYLHDIAQHESAVNALFRTLREDSKKSMQLTYNILRICLDFARIIEFRPVLLKHKIPQLTLDIIDFELERYEKWKVQMSLLEEKAASKPQSGRVLNDYHAMVAKLNEFTDTQNSLLKVAFEILHCVSEKKIVREALLGQRVICSLGEGLERKDNEILDVILLYLRDLSSYSQCIDQMIIAEVVDKLAKILKGGAPIPRKTISAALQLLYNLSFHPVLCARIVSCELISVLALCFEKSPLQDIAGKALYVLSMNPKVRRKLGKSSFVITLMNRLTDHPENSVPQVLGCLAVNLAMNERCVGMMWESDKVSQLVMNALKNEDVLAMKIIRNLAEHEAVFVLYERIEDIASAMVGSSDQEFVTECIGSLSCFDPYRVHVDYITEKGRIFPWLKQTLGYYIDLVQRDSIELIVIEDLLLLASLCRCEDGARVIVGEGFTELLMKILHLSNKDTEILQQVLSVFNKCTEHESISVFFALKTRIPSGLLEFAETSIGHLKQLSESALDRIAIFDDTWKENMQQYHFLSWNKDWTDAITLEELERDQGVVRPMTAGISFEDFQKGNRYDIEKNRRILLTGSSDSDPDVDQSRQSSGMSGNDSDLTRSNFFGLFKHQFEEEMAVQQRQGYGDQDDLFENHFDYGDYESDSDAGWH